MRIAVMAVTLVLASGGAMAQSRTWVERDELGRKTGTVEQTDSGDLIRRDAQGRTESKAERQKDGGYVVKDALGRPRARVERER
jgi:hypothetical protein